MPKFACLLCGAVKRARVKTRTHIFCSNSCKGTWWMSRHKLSGTDIEVIMADALKARGIQFREQVRFGRFVADFILDDHGIAISCDGDFWHACYNGNNRDERQTERLRKSGFEVHRFLGSQILENVNACLDSISVLRPAVRTNGA